MTEMMRNLIQIESRLATLSCLEGHTITETMIGLLLDTCETLNSIIDDLKEMEREEAR